MQIHELKTEKRYFVEIWNEKKYFEVRKNDRNFQVGDILKLIEIEHKMFKDQPTGRVIKANINYILKDDFIGLRPGYVVLSIQLISCAKNY